MPVRGAEGRVGLTLGTHEELQGEGNPQLPGALSFILVQLALCVPQGSKEQPSMNPGQSPRDRLWFWERRGQRVQGTLLLAVPAPKHLSSQEAPGSTLACNYAQHPFFRLHIILWETGMPRKLVGGCPRAPGRMGKPLALTKLSSSDLLPAPPPPPTPPPHYPPPHTAACLSWKGSRGRHV